MINTPIDALNWMKGKKVTVISKQREKLQGTLVAFDLSQNMSIQTRDGLKFIQGQSVADVSVDEENI